MSNEGKVFDHSGSSFDGLLQEEGILEHVDKSAIRRVLEWAAKGRQRSASISKDDSEAQVSAAKVPGRL